MKKIRLSIFPLFIILMLSACTKDNMQVASTSEMGYEPGQSGSLARFAVTNNVLYTVSGSSLKIFDISNAAAPQQKTTTSVNRNIESLFPLGNTLFIGSSDGMYIYDISKPESPAFLSSYNHILSCDPVVADSKYAYVTLHVESRCRRSTNELDVVDITNLRSPRLVRAYDMTKPLGLGIDNGKLFVCDNGLKVYDAKDPNNLQQQQYFKINAVDVIPRNNVLIVVGNDGIYQYGYGSSSTNPNTVEVLSKINVTPGI